MSADFVLPALSTWATSHITNLMRSTTTKDFSAAFDATFAMNCNITFNGKALSREEYKTKLFAQSAAFPTDLGTSVSIEGVNEVETGGDQLAGLVGIFSTTYSDSKYLILGAPAESRASSSLNLVIQPTEKNPNPHNTSFDPRRVVEVNQVVSQKTYNVTIPTAAVPKDAATSSSSGKVELGPGPVRLPDHFKGKEQWSPFGGYFGPGPVRIPQNGSGKA